MFLSHQEVDLLESESLLIDSSHSLSPSLVFVVPDEFTT